MKKYLVILVIFFACSTEEDEPKIQREVEISIRVKGFHTIDMDFFVNGDLQPNNSPATGVSYEGTLENGSTFMVNTTEDVDFEYDIYVYYTVEERKTQDKDYYVLNDPMTSVIQPGEIVTIWFK